jgi:hypothetical protein
MTLVRNCTLNVIYGMAKDLLISIRTQQQTGNAGSPRVKHAVVNINGSRKAKGCLYIHTGQTTKPG